MIVCGCCYYYIYPKKNTEEQKVIVFLGCKVYSDKLFLIDFLFVKAVSGLRKKKCAESTEFPHALSSPPTQLQFLLLLTSCISLLHFL